MFVRCSCFFVVHERKSVVLTAHAKAKFSEAAFAVLDGSTEREISTPRFRGFTLVSLHCLCLKNVEWLPTYCIKAAWKSLLPEGWRIVLLVSRAAHV
jgi:hypothetical protein